MTLHPDRFRRTPAGRYLLPSTLACRTPEVQPREYLRHRGTGEEGEKTTSSLRNCDNLGYTLPCRSSAIKHGNPWTRRTTHRSRSVFKLRFRLRFRRDVRCRASSAQALSRAL